MYTCEFREEWFTRSNRRASSDLIKYGERRFRDYCLFFFCLETYVFFIYKSPMASSIIYQGRAKPVIELIMILTDIVFYLWYWKDYYSEKIEATQEWIYILCFVSRFNWILREWWLYKVKVRLSWVNQSVVFSITYTYSQSINKLSSID